MIYHKITVNGTGVITPASIKEFQLVESANDADNLNYGSVCAAEMQASIRISPDVPALKYGDCLVLSEAQNKGAYNGRGTFYVESAEKVSDVYCKVTAYDSVSKLDADLTYWLNNEASFPMSLDILAQTVVSYCGLSLQTTSLPLGDTLIQKFGADRITGRDFCRWIGQMTGTFCHADFSGAIRFDSYSPSPVTIADRDYFGDLTVSKSGSSVYIDTQSTGIRCLNGSLTLSGSLVSSTCQTGELTIFSVDKVPKYLYYQDGYEPSTFEVKPIEKVQVGMSDSDIGALYPDDPSAKNLYKVSENYLINDIFAPRVALRLYNDLKSLRYSPTRISIPYDPRVKAGQMMNVYRKGDVTSFLVMKVEESGGRMALSCTGSESRESSTATTSQTFKALTGKYLDLKTDVKGIHAEVGNLSESTKSRFDMTSSAIEAEVSSRKKADTELSAALKVQADAISAEATKRERMGQFVSDNRAAIKINTDSIVTEVSKREALSNDVTSLTGTVTEQSSQISQNASSIAAKVSKTGSNTDRSFAWDMSDEDMTWTRTYQDSEGASVTDEIFKLSATGGEFSGKIIASSGEIGGLTIANSGMHTGNGSWTHCDLGEIYFGPDGINLGEQFYVRADTGEMTAKDAVITGEVTATSGKIGGWAIGTGLNTGNGTWSKCADGEVYFGPEGINFSEKFYVDKSGKVTSTSGEIAGWTITDSGLNTGTGTWNNCEDGEIFVGPDGINIANNFKVDNAGKVNATSGTFSGSVYAGKISYGDLATTGYGYFSGAGLSALSVTGGKEGKLALSSITTLNTIDGINTSLGNGDFARDCCIGDATATDFKATNITCSQIYFRKKQFVVDSNGYVKAIEIK